MDVLKESANHDLGIAREMSNMPEAKYRYGKAKEVKDRTHSLASRILVIMQS